MPLHKRIKEEKTNYYCPDRSKHFRSIIEEILTDASNFDHVAKQLWMRKLWKYPAIESDRRVLAPNKGTLAAQHSRLGGDAKSPLILQARKTP